jgi:hypothetical protein
MPDKGLERRLVVSAKYTSRPGDTLERIAALLYGHKTWWARLSRGNPGLSRLGSGDAVPEGTEIRYKAPKVGDEYVVRQGEWLARIAEWKYGSSDSWKEIFHRNALAIEDPDLIHPGDHLHFNDDGTIVNQQTGKVLVQGVGPPKPVAANIPAVNSAPVSAVTPVRAPAASMRSWVEPQIDPRGFALGFVAGVLFMVLLRRVGSAGFATYDSGHSSRGRRDLDGEPDEAEAEKALERRPSYHSLLRSRLKKYLK